MSKFNRTALVGTLTAAAAGMANAAADLTPITNAQSTALEYAGGIAACVIAIWGAKLAYRKFFGG